MKESKFEKKNKNITSLKEIVDTLKGLTEGRQDTEKVEMYVKDVIALVEDLDVVIKTTAEIEESAKEINADPKKDEDKDKDEEEDKDEEDKDKDEGEDKDKEDKDEDEGDKDKETGDSEDDKDKKDTGEEESNDAEEGEGSDKDDESKQSEVSKFKTLCEEYSQKLKEANTLLATKDEIISKLSNEKVSLVEQISKFKEQEIKEEKGRYDKAMSGAVKAYSKFKNLPVDHQEVLDKKKEWMTSKMSESALLELGKTYEETNISKMSKEPKVETKPSSQLDGTNERTSKMSKKDKMKAIANKAALKQGFRGPLLE